MRAGFTFFGIIALCCIPWRAGLRAQQLPPGDCFRPSAGAAVEEPGDIRSQKGILTGELTVYDHVEPDGSVRYCYVDARGQESPTLRVKPGDLVVLTLKNELTAPPPKPTSASASASAPSASPTLDHMAGQMPDHMHDRMHDHMHDGAHGDASQPASSCASDVMSPVSTNLHFHGLTIPPTCHEDDVLHTSIHPGDPPFEYRFRIPADEPPGLYWYHPHIHGFSKVQVLGGASGAIIVEGIERAEKAAAGLPERVLIIRDQDLLNPNLPPSKSEPVVPKMLFDRDGDAANTGTGFGKPAKDLSVNFVPVPYPDYRPAAMRMKPGERQLWRVLNASAITYLNLAVLFDRVPQPLGLVGLDGVPINESGALGDFVDWQTHLGLPPGARAEFIVQGPPAGVQALLVTRAVDTGPGGENDPNRTLATIAASTDAPEPPSRLPASPEPLPPPGLPWLATVTPVRTRHLYFSETLLDPNNPNSATEFYITVDGQTPAPFDPKSGVPNIVVQQGTVEDWIIENRSDELHAFHIHQLHFMLMDYMGVPANEPFLRDTINVPYYDGRSLAYPSVRLRMDFRDPNIVGDFVYHCHLLEHEDNGMMGLIRVLPAQSSQSARPNHSGAPSAATAPHASPTH